MTNNDVKKIAIMGGTFDPIHYGHLVTAEAVRREYGAEFVLFIPTGRPPHKPGQVYATSGPERRYIMTELATASNPYFRASRVEIDRPGESYTIDTINELREIYVNAKIYFITGADAIYQILTWKDAELLLTRCSFIAATRPGYNNGKLYEHVQNVKAKYKSKVHFLEVPSLAISSSDIRDRVRAGRTIKYLLPVEVENYIYKYGLYADGAAVKYNGLTVGEINAGLKAVLSEKRYIHTQGVVSEALKLADRYGADRDAAHIAALLHDCAKYMRGGELIKFCDDNKIEYGGDMKKNPELLHSFAGAYIAETKYGVDDIDTLNAIKYHTTGRAGMSRLEKIIYVADFIEPNREPFERLDDIRKMAYNDIDEALVSAIKATIEYVGGKGLAVYPLSVQALESLSKNN